VDEAVERVRADYDAAPYESHAYPESAPGRIAVIAHLLGLDTPEVSTARVVEIGCAAGGNLIPFAAEHPQACQLDQPGGGGGAFGSTGSGRNCTGPGGKFVPGGGAVPGSGWPSSSCGT
jgi:hypothetical protein